MPFSEEDLIRPKPSPLPKAMREIPHHPTNLGFIRINMAITMGRTKTLPQKLAKPAKKPAPRKKASLPMRLVVLSTLCSFLFILLVNIQKYPE